MRPSKREKKPEKITHLMWPNYQIPKEENMGWTNNSVPFYQFFQQKFYEAILLCRKLYQICRYIKVTFWKSLTCMRAIRITHLLGTLGLAFQPKWITGKLLELCKTIILAQYFYNVKHGSSIITSKSSSKILSNSRKLAF